MSVLRQGREAFRANRAIFASTSHSSSNLTWHLPSYFQFTSSFARSTRLFESITAVYHTVTSLACHSRYMPPFLWTPAEFPTLDKPF